jgi:hypothetical protein
LQTIELHQTLEKLELWSASVDDNDIELKRRQVVSALAQNTILINRVLDIFREEVQDAEAV